MSSFSGRSQFMRPPYYPATVQATVSEAEIEVLVDGSTESTYALNMIGVHLTVGDRVLLDFAEPAGAYVVGVLGNPFVWQQWIPTVVQSSALTLKSATAMRHRRREDGWAEVAGYILIGSTGVTSNEVEIRNLPYDLPGEPNEVIGYGYYRRSSAAQMFNFIIDAQVSGGVSYLRMMTDSTTTSSSGLGVEPAFATAVDDQIRLYALWNPDS